MKALLILSGAIIAILAIAGTMHVISSREREPSMDTPVPAAPDEAAERTVEGFAWDLADVEDSEYDETEVTLIVRYDDGTSQRIGADTVEGSCYDEDVETALAPGSTQITCYYAGLGHKFRVLDSDDAYLLQMRVFEEAGPDYAPPVQEFETIATIKKLP